MRRITFILLAILLPFWITGQTIVDTEPQNKSVVLEQYTGINCGFCPQGAQIAAQIYNANPDRVVLIAVHAGGFANPGAGQPDFRTPFGPGLLGQTGITGFPAGTVNRHVFPGWGMSAGGTGMGRNHWTNAANQILGHPSYLNIAAEAEIDLQTRELTVYVEVYYTDDSPFDINKLNVALLQDKTYAFQAGGSANYEHNNRLVHLLTGQWGDDIAETTQGKLTTKTYTYTIPEHYNQIPAELGNMRVAAFVAETTQEIISGVQVTPELTNLAEFEYAIAGHSMASSIWEGEVEPVFTLKSLCTELTSLDIEYFVNDEEVHTYSWEGSLTYGQEEEVHLPEITFLILPENTLTINILNEDDSPEDNSIVITMERAVASIYQDLTVEVKVDQWGSENTWNIKNQEGTTVANGGPYANQANTHTHEITIPAGNYTLTILDSYGDGIPGGHIKLIDETSTLIHISGNSFSSIASEKFRIVEPATVDFDPAHGEEVEADEVLSIWVSKQVLTETYAPASEHNYHEIISLRKNDASGSEIPFTATVSEHKVFTITPEEELEEGSTVYLEINAMDADFLQVHDYITLTVAESGGGVNVAELTASELLVFPNPASDKLTIKLPEHITVAQLKLFCSNGQKVHTATITSEETLDIKNLAPGIYFVNIVAENNNIQKKLLITR